MKTVVLFTLITVGFFITALEAKNPTKEKDDYGWLINEVEDLYEEETLMTATESMVFIYDNEGNEIISYQESDYDNLPSDIKRKVSQSEFLFDTMGDSFYLISE